MTDDRASASGSAMVRMWGLLSAMHRGASHYAELMAYSHINVVGGIDATEVLDRYVSHTEETTKLFQDILAEARRLQENDA